MRLHLGRRVDLVAATQLCDDSSRPCLPRSKLQHHLSYSFEILPMLDLTQSLLKSSRAFGTLQNKLRPSCNPKPSNLTPKTHSALRQVMAKATASAREALRDLAATRVSGSCFQRLQFLRFTGLKRRVSG